ncbi:MAG TPA: sulfite exporter TauE/SafE family protein [bacterium]|nr:sulfite exporter TauE/SafE family protein [bacterium]
MYETIITPLLVGISTGMFCMTTCVPFIAPVLVTEERNSRKTIQTILQFMLGRLIGYLAFGTFFGWLGEKLTNDFFLKISSFAMLLLSCLMILHALGLLQPRNKFCALTVQKAKVPFWIGLLTGVNLCPPFLVSLTYIFTYGNVIRGILFFFLFFLGTNIYFIPLVLLGHLSTIAVFRKSARYAALIVGSSFAIYSMLSLIRTTPLSHLL